VGPEVRGQKATEGMALFHKVVVTLIIVLSVVHISVTPTVFKEFGIREVDFVCRGLTGMFLAFLNIAFRRHQAKDALLRWLCLLSNAITTLLWALVLVAVGQSPQGYLVVALFAALFLGSAAIAATKPKLEGRR